MTNTCVWFGKVRWRLNTFTVEAEIDEDCSGTYVSEICKLYWDNETSKIGVDVVDLIVDVATDECYNALTDAVITAYLDYKQKGE